jgi:hypothetical protein
LDAPDQLARMCFPNVTNYQISMRGFGIAASAAAAAPDLCDAYVGGSAVSSVSTRVGPLAAIGVTRWGAGLVGIEVGFDRAIERVELGLEDLAPEQGAHTVQMKACPPTCRRHLHLHHSSSIQLD